MRSTFGALCFVLLASCSGTKGGGDGGPPGPHGWMAGSGGLIAAMPDGQSVQPRASPTTHDLHSLVCVGHQLGWAAGDSGTIIATRDGGEHWSVQSTPTLSTLRAAYFADASAGLAVGDGGTLLRTGDGGSSWAAVSSPVSSALRSVAFASDRSRAWAVGDGGVVLRSSDGGASWMRISTPTTAALRAVRFADDALHGIAVGDAAIGTSDGGATWAALAQPPAALNGLSISGQRAVAVGANGLVWRSADAGGTWQQVVAPATSTLNAVGFASDDLQFGWAVGAGGTLLVTDDGGAHFRSVATGLASDIESVEDL